MHKILIRIAILTLLLLAIVDVKIPVASTKTCRIYLVDISDSISTGSKDIFDEIVYLINWDVKKNLKDDDLAGLVVFAEDVAFEENIKQKKVFPLVSKIKTVMDGSSTAIADALSIVSNIFPADYNKEIVLFTDGNFSAKELTPLLIKLEANNIFLKVMPSGPRVFKDVKITSVHYPNYVRAGQEFEIGLTLSSNCNASVDVILESEERTQNRTLSLEEGQTVGIKFSESMPPDKPFIRFEVKIVSPDIVDDCPENNHLTFFVINQTDKINLLYLHKRRTLLWDILQNIQGINVVASNTYQEPFLFDVVVVDNYPADGLTPEQMRSIKTYVEQGGGLFYCGGELSFAVGKYQGTPIEEVLPFWAFPQEAITLLYILDASGSMQEKIETIPKFITSIDAIKKSTIFLDKGDLAGVAMFSDKPQPVFDIRPAEILAQRIDELKRHRPSGPTLIVPSLEFAIESLKFATTARRQVILITDAETEEDIKEFERISLQLKQNRIPVAVIITGKHPSLDKMRLISDTILQVKDIFGLEKGIEEVLAKSKELVIRGKLQVSLQQDELTDGLSSAGELRCINRVSARPVAKVLLQANGNPLVGVAGYGSGRAVAFASEFSQEWMGEMLEWKDFLKFIQRLFIWVARKGGAQVDIETKWAGNDLYLTLTFPQEIVPQSASLESTFIDLAYPERQRGHLIFEIDGGGRYKGVLKEGKKGSYLISIPQAGAKAIVNVPLMPEYSQLGVNIGNLKSIVEVCGGVIIWEPAGLSQKSRAVEPIYMSLRAVFLTIALILFVLDIILRVYA